MASNQLLLAQAVIDVLGWLLVPFAVILVINWLVSIFQSYK